MLLLIIFHHLSLFYVANCCFAQSNINVATIQDGFKADYYYDINVSATIPAKYKGQLHTFNITFNPQYFDALPGSKQDPTGSATHDYTLSIPPLVIAIPSDGSANAADAGKIFYSSGYAHNLVWAHNINPTFTPTVFSFCPFAFPFLFLLLTFFQEVQFVDAATAIPPLSQIAANQINRVANLRNYWHTLTSTHNDSCSFWYKVLILFLSSPPSPKILFPY